MRLPPGSRALRRRSSLPHSVVRRAPRDGTVGLRKPVSCDPVQERDDKVFGERQHGLRRLLPGRRRPLRQHVFFNQCSVCDLILLFRDNDSDFASSNLCRIAYCILLLDCMTSLLPIILAKFYLLYLWIKLCEKIAHILNNKGMYRALIR